MTLEIEQIQNDLKQRLSEHRYQHTQSVVETAIKFAQAYKLSNEEIKKLELAAWLHDCCKELKNEELLQLAEFYQIEIYEEDELHPNILHARVGAAWVEEEYEIMDPEITYAVADHTLGSAEMSDVAKILFLADMLEPLRGDNEELTRLRNLVMAAEDLDSAVLDAMNSKIKYVMDKNQPVHPLSIIARNSLL
ncbi:MAG: bis(5'-nucleosyl)-tetraphosphatase (symmetrical) YqeK [Candidatus Melainabacteria bacterium]|nr:bis(5'-nucleosyl)-tetraphosphatase (symmetrical) YqeK [Candidatus Melainabacteria bacterium]